MRTTADIAAWREQNPGQRLDLRGADLRGAHLSWADLSEADLRGSNLSGADLSGADLREADLNGANFYRADLRGAHLSWADLSEADLRGSNLSGADLSGADLIGARLPHFQLPEGDLIVWGKKSGVLVKLMVSMNARRTACLINRKCRAEYAMVLEVMNESGSIAVSNQYGYTTYTVGEIVYPDSYDDDIRVDCTHGIHFFATRAEAEEW